MGRPSGLLQRRRARLEGVREADEEGQALPCRGVLSGPLRSFSFPCTHPCNAGAWVWLYRRSFSALALAPLKLVRVVEMYRSRIPEHFPANMASTRHRASNYHRLCTEHSRVGS